jgi:hypothetical protein
MSKNKFISFRSQILNRKSAEGLSKLLIYMTVYGVISFVTIDNLSAEINENYRQWGMPNFKERVWKISLLHTYLFARDNIKYFFVVQDPLWKVDSYSAGLRNYKKKSQVLYRFHCACSSTSSIRSPPSHHFCKINFYIILPFMSTSSMSPLPLKFLDQTFVWI